jgi:hypothetical protein
MSRRTNNVLAELEAVEEQTSRLGRYVDMWNDIRQAVNDVQTITEKDLGYSPTETGQSRHVNVAKLLEVRDRLTEISDGLNGMMIAGLQGANARIAQSALGEVKHKFYSINRMIDGEQKFSMFLELMLCF